jgi:hypothetical protein
VRKAPSRIVGPNANATFRNLASNARDIGLSRLSELLELAFRDDIRNGISHTDYVIWDDGLRLRKRNGGHAELVSFEDINGALTRGMGFFQKRQRGRSAGIRTVAASDNRHVCVGQRRLGAVVGRQSEANATVRGIDSRRSGSVDRREIVDPAGASAGGGSTLGRCDVGVERPGQGRGRCPRGCGAWTRRCAVVLRPHPLFDPGVVDGKHVEEKQQEDARAKGWEMLTHAAFRGSSVAQNLVDRTMNEQGDFLGASRWFGSAAAAGVADFENSFVWFLATCPDPEFRDPPKALSVALDAVRHSEIERAADGTSGAGSVARQDVLDALAAADAAVGDFAGAIETESKVLEIMRSSPDRKVVVVAEAKLVSYKAGKAWIVHVAPDKDRTSTIDHPKS